MSMIKTLKLSLICIFLLSSSSWATSSDDQDQEFLTSGCVTIEGTFIKIRSEAIMRFGHLNQLCVGDELWLPTSGPRSGEFAVEVTGINATHFRWNYSYPEIVPLNVIWENDYSKYGIYKPEPGEILPRELRRMKEREQTIFGWQEFTE